MNPSSPLSRLKKAKIYSNHVSLFSDQCGKIGKIVVYSHFCATVGDLPEGFKEYPMFPGTDPKVIKGKSFKTMAIDIHEVLDGKIKKTWHIEDWLTALNQLLGKQKFINLERPILLEEGESMTEIPWSIPFYYDTILNDFSKNAQDLAFLKKVLTDDFNMCPNPFDPTEDSGPGVEGFKGLSINNVTPFLRFSTPP